MEGREGRLLHAWKGGPTNCYRLVTSTVAEGKWAVMKGATTVANWAKQ